MKRILLLCIAACAVTFQAVAVNYPSCTPPSITLNLMNETCRQGAAVQFTVAVSGSTPVWFLWSENGTNLVDGGNISGVTSWTLTITNVQAYQSGNYSVLIYNSCGSTNSAIATLTVLPSVAIQPTNQIIVAGGTATFSALVSGTNACDGPFTYQWLHNGTNLNMAFITSVAGHGTGNPGTDTLGDGDPATNAILSFPTGVAMDTAGNLYIADSEYGLVRKVDTNGIISVVAGGGLGGGADGLGDGGLAADAILNSPNAVAVDGAGNLYIADSQDIIPGCYETGLIRKVDTNGIITVMAGGGPGGGADVLGDGGAATNAAIHSPKGVAVDSAGNLYIADWGNGLLRKVDTNGIITIAAGNVAQQVQGDGGTDEWGDGGEATNAILDPAGVVVDSAGNLYIADAEEYYIDSTSYGLIRKVNTNGIITLVAGGGQTTGGTDQLGDGGWATNAILNSPNAVAVDGAGNLYIADSQDYIPGSSYLTVGLIRKVNTNGMITVVAGGGAGGGADSLGDGGPATGACLNSPSGVTMDAAGNLYIADAGDRRIREVSASMATFSLFDVTTNDGGSYQVILSSPCGSVTSSAATVTVEVPPTITQQPANLAAIQSSNAVFSVTASGTPLNYQWWFDGTNLITGATNATLVLTNVQNNQAGFYNVVITNYAGSVTSDFAGLTIRYGSYVAFSGASTNLINGYTFQSDTTYFIDTQISLSATTTIEGGSVIKFSTNGTLNVLGPLVCKTGPYRPAILTSKDDNSVGVPIPGSTGNPQTATNGLAYLSCVNYLGWPWIATNGLSIGERTISGLRFAYADKGLTEGNSGLYKKPGGVITATLHVWDCQFVNCNWGIADWFIVHLAVYDLHNTLFAGCQSAFGGSTSTQTVVTAEQLTSDTVNFWETSSNTLTAVSLTNSIILGGFQFASSTTVSTNSVALDPSGSVFQPVGAANYYLPPGSQYHHAGTTNISSQMLAELAQKTTYAPTVWADMTISGTQNLVPQVARDTGTSSGFTGSIGNSSPDLGYHYDPIDYAFSTVDAINGTLTVMPGTVIAAFASYSETLGDTYGLNIDGGSKLICRGLANQLNHIVQYKPIAWFS